MKRGTQHVARMAALILVAVASSILNAETHEVKLERNVAAKMRDGTLFTPTSAGQRQEERFLSSLNALHTTRKMEWTFV